jgi:glycosyltransferase involved in cell wall biosynthesis
VKDIPRVVCIAWAKRSSRLDEISGSVGGTPIKISLLSGRRFLAPIRYLYLGIRTCSILLGADADVVIAQNPPIFCALSAYIAVRSGRRLIIDHHSLAGERNGWLNRAVLGRVEEWLARKALVNTVIHEGYAEVLERMGARSLVLYDAPPVMEVHRRGGKDQDKGRKDFTIVCPLGGHPDEEVDSLIEAVERVEGVRLVITGKWASPRDLRDHPNIEYAGFVPSEDYAKIISEADLGVCLLKGNEMTLPYVLFEFASAELPFLVSSTRTTSRLGDTFLVKNSEDLRRRIEGLRYENDYSELWGKTRELKAYFDARSREGREELRKLLQK